MRALQIVHSDDAGGVKTLAEIIGGGLTARGVAVETAVLFPAPGLRPKLIGTLRVAGRILAGRYDAVIAYQPSASILTGIVGWLARCPLRIVHQTALPNEIKALMRWFDRVAGTLGLYTVNVVNSHATAAAYARYPARYRRTMLMIEHGVATPKPARGRAATLAAFGVPAGRILLNVGRLTEQKNQDVLIRALARVPSARLVIAGDGRERPDYAALAAQLGVTDRLHLLGDVTRADIADLLAAADLFVFPSTWETFGLAAVEAAMAGVAIVAADLPVLREVLSAQGGAAATFVAPFDTEGWVNAINSSAQVDHAKRAAIVHAVAQRYSVARMVDAYAALLEHEAHRSGDPALKQMEPHGTGVA
jgi:glycosyltransferase involved in cell wall biosynthesis